MIKQTIFVFALLFLVGAVGASSAQTLSFAEAIDQLAAACRTDLQKYCKGVELGGGHLKACLDGHQNVVSPQCQQTRMAVYASISRRIAAQRNIGSRQPARQSRRAQRMRRTSMPTQPPWT